MEKKINKQETSVYQNVVMGNDAASVFLGEGSTVDKELCLNKRPRYLESQVRSDSAEMRSSPERQGLPTLEDSSFLHKLRDIMNFSAEIKKSLVLKPGVAWLFTDLDTVFSFFHVHVVYIVWCSCEVHVTARV